jgi:hypothetical protein
MGDLLTLELFHVEGVPAVGHGCVGAGRVGVLLVVGVELAEPVEPRWGVGAVVAPIGVGALAAGQAGDLPEEGPGVVVGLHVLVAVVDQQVGIPGLDGSCQLRAGHPGFL